MLMIGTLLNHLMIIFNAAKIAHVLIAEIYVLKYINTDVVECDQITQRSILWVCIVAAAYSLLSVLDSFNYIKEKYENCGSIGRYFILILKIVGLATIHGFSIMQIWKLITPECQRSYETSAHKLWLLFEVTYWYITIVLTFRFLELLMMCCCTSHYEKIIIRYKQITDNSLELKVDENYEKMNTLV